VPQSVTLSKIAAWARQRTVVAVTEAVAVTLELALPLAEPDSEPLAVAELLTVPDAETVADKLPVADEDTLLLPLVLPVADFEAELVCVELALCDSVSLCRQVPSVCGARGRVITVVGYMQRRPMI
jgi:hypothetical protein